MRNIQPILDELTALYPAGVKPGRKADGPPPRPNAAGIPADDQQLLDRMFASKHGDKIRRLWAGDSSDFGGDASRGDLSLCGALAFFTGGDRQRVDRLFRQSGRRRAKWDEKRGGTTYGQRTIDTALEGKTEFYSPGQRDTTGGQTTAGQSTELANDAVDNPHRLAAGFLGTLAERSLRYFRGEFAEWAGGAYAVVPDDDIRGRLTAWARAEFVRANAAEVAAWRAGGDLRKGPPAVRRVTLRLIGDTLNALRSLVAVPSHVHPPAWLDGWAGPDPADVLAFPNGLLDIPTGTLHAPTPAFFTFNAVGFDYDPAAPTPAIWEQFLQSLWADDPDSVACLQEWFGYLLTPDTRQQKLLFLLGPKRSGKGTIARVLKELLGGRNYSGPTLNGLTTEFGLSPLVGKAVAVISDARVSGRADGSVVVERLLAITGEDTVTVNRKYRPQLDVKLGVRFVIISNELLKLGDASGALTGRMILLRLTRSFFGQEDPTLTDRLLGELPGILLWALAGLRRLRARGRFVQPPSGAELLADLAELASPVGAFVADECEVAADAWASVADLFARWKGWCVEHGREPSGSEQSFGRDLWAAVTGLKSHRPRLNGERPRGYTGIRLRVRDPQPGGG